MKRALVLVAVFLSCGAPFTPPDPIERDLGDGQRDVPRGSLGEYTEDAGAFEFPDAGCCVVRFALAAQGEAAVELFGFGPPLVDPVTMRLDGGVWEAEACMGLTESLYGFRRYIPTDDDAGLFSLVSANPNSPQLLTEAYGTLNVFSPDDAGTCDALDVAPYADTSARDAGMLIDDLDGG